MRRNRKQFSEPGHVVCWPGPGQARGGHVARGGGQERTGDKVQLLRVQGELETGGEVHRAVYKLSLQMEQDWFYSS